MHFVYAKWKWTEVKRIYTSLYASSNSWSSGLTKSPGSFQSPVSLTYLDMKHVCFCILLFTQLSNQYYFIMKNKDCMLYLLDLTVSLAWFIYKVLEFLPHGCHKLREVVCSIELLYHISKSFNLWPAICHCEWEL